MDFKLPELGEGVYDAEVVRWLVKPGESVKRGQGLLEVLTDKATMEVPAPFAGKVEALKTEPGEQVKVGDLILTYEQHGGELPATSGNGAEKPMHAPASSSAAAGNAAPDDGLHHHGEETTPGSVKAAPSVRLRARQLGIDLTKIQGSGPQGRVLLADIQRTSPAVRTDGDGAAAPVREARAGTGMELGQPGTKIKLAGLRRKIAEHMTLSKSTIPDYTYVDECDVTDLVKLRESLKETFASKGLKLTYLTFIVKAVVRALKEVPLVNSSLDEAAGEIVLHDQYHIGIAAATAGGLIVPVIHHADRLGLTEIAREIERLSSDARQGKNKLEDLRGGTFSVTSIGNLGGLFATPIIPLPQVGILGVGKIVKRPVYDAHDRIRPAHMLYLSMTFDHRVLDGAVGTVFGNALIKQLQNPAGLLID